MAIKTWACVYLTTVVVGVFWGLQLIIASELCQHELGLSSQPTVNQVIMSMAYAKTDSVLDCVRLPVPWVKDFF